MFLIHLRRELGNRRKQTVVVAVGLALAVALVVVVSSVSAGVQAAQATVLQSVYGVGTDITVSQPGERGSGGPGRFDIGAEDGATDDGGSRTFSQDRLSVATGTGTLDASTLDTVAGLDHVAGVAATLELSNTSFDGEMPDPSQAGQDGGRGQGGALPPAGGADGAGGSAFEIDSFTVTGVDPAADAVGPLTTVELADGRTLDTDDASAEVAVVDATYAETNELAVGDTVSVGGTDVEIVGTVASSTGDGVATASDVYVPLALAQTLAGLEGHVTDLYVQADSASEIDAVAAAVEETLPEASVSTQSDLASSVTGSLSTASSLVSSLGTWLSAIVLAAAFGLAILFTVSGVNRRTRELGTLKAIGWSRGRVVGQVAGESVVQGLLGGVLGVLLGVLAVVAVNLSGITLSGSSGGFTLGGPGGGPAGGTTGQTAGQTTGAGGGGAPFGGGGNPFSQAASAVDVVLSAPVLPLVVVAAVGLAVLGGLLAGVVGGARAARLRPAEALRSVA
jgi:putative ABC transport system permease protein